MRYIIDCICVKIKLYRYMYLKIVYVFELYISNYGDYIEVLL